MADFARGFTILAAFLAIAVAATFLRAGITGAYTYSSGATASLGIWDQTESKGGGYTKFSYKTSYDAHGGECWNKGDDKFNIYVFANYTDSSSVAINDSAGTCYIRYDRDGSGGYGGAGEQWIAMSYNASSYFWENFTNFTYKGILKFQVNCTSPTHDNFLLSDNTSINNTGPCIFGQIGGDPNGDLPMIQCFENSICQYDFSQNCSDDDQNDVGSLLYNYTVDAQYEPYFSMTTGVLEVNMTNLSIAELIIVDLQVKDNQASIDATTMNITVNPVNDAPQFVTLPDGATEDVEFNSSSPGGVITATDEEGDYPLNFTINITGCNKAFWIKGPWRNNCSLFGWNQTSGTTVEILNFTPTNRDVGNYTVNYSVRDSGNTTLPYNATYWEIKTFTVTNVNDGPDITAINGTSIELNQSDTLYVIFNGTDIENDTLAFYAITLYRNLTPCTDPGLFTITKDDTDYPNESAYGIMNYVLTNDHVGNYTLNVTVEDNGTNPLNLSASILVNLTVYNINDPPALENITYTLLAVQEEPFYYYFNASDPDLLTFYGDNLSFSFNFTQCSTLNGTADCNDFGANSTFNVTKLSNTAAYMHIIAERNDTGNYTMNLTVTDEGGLVNWTMINITVMPDWPPVVHAPSSLELNQTVDFWADFNITDAENDTLNVTYRVLYRNLTQYPTDLFPINVSSATYPPYYNLTMNYTPVTNDQVGNYTIEVNATDVWNRSTSVLINLTAWNVNDPPQIINFTSCTGSATYPLNISIPENLQNCLELNNPDIDLLTPYSDNLTYGFTTLGCSASGSLPPGGNCSGKILISESGEIGYLNFTADNESWQGNYTFNISVTDIENRLAWALVNISIYAVNDGPELISLAIENESSNGTNATYYFPISSTVTFTEGDSYNLTVSATDEEGNTPIYYNVSFTCSLDKGGTDCGLFAIDWTSGEANFTANENQTGNYTVNFTARDSGNLTLPHNATGWGLVNFTIFVINKDPVINTFSCFGSCDMTEGQTKMFAYQATDADEQYLTCYLYLDWLTATETLADTKEKCNTSSLQLWEYDVSYDDALNYSKANRTMTLLIEDPFGSTSNQTLNVTVTNVNRAPRRVQNISSPIKWQSSTSISAIDLDNYFDDDYGEVLSYTYTGAPNVNVDIDPVTNIVTLTPKGNWYGTDWVVFVANDTILTNQSNNVTLIVEYKPPETRDVPTSYPTPRVASLEVIVPEIITIQLGHSSMARVVLHNDGQYDLFDINLTAVTNESNISLALMDTFITDIRTGQNVTTWLNITLGDLDINQTYLAQVIADVGVPGIEETATITIKANPINKTLMYVDIVMVKDLFEENPECMELFGLIVEAEERLEAGDIGEAKRLTKLAMDNCQDMIDYAKLKGNLTTEAQPATVGQVIVNPFFILGFVLALMALCMVGYWLMIRRQPAAAQAPV